MGHLVHVFSWQGVRLKAFSNEMTKWNTPRSPPVERNRTKAV